MSEDDEEQAKISFDPPEYKVMENCGLCEVQVIYMNFCTLLLFYYYKQKNPQNYQRYVLIKIYQKVTYITVI